MARLGHNSRMVWATRVYNSVERDPEIDRAHEKFNKERIKESDLAMLAGLSPSTVANLLSRGKTRRPQHATFVKLWGAMGFRYDLVRDEKPDYEAAIPQARGEWKAYKETMAKKKGRNGHAKKGARR